MKTNCLGSLYRTDDGDWIATNLVEVGFFLARGHAPAKLLPGHLVRDKRIGFVFTRTDAFEADRLAFESNASIRIQSLVFGYSKARALIANKFHRAPVAVNGRGGSTPKPSGELSQRINGR